MGWTNDQATEITAPSDVPFLPGNDVIGMGTGVPQELRDYGVDAAIVFYNSGWNPAATVPSVKFMWIGTYVVGGLGSISFGFGIAANPSVDQTAVISNGLTLGTYVNGAVTESTLSLFNLNNTVVWTAFADASHNGREIGNLAAGPTLWDLPGNPGV